MHTQSQILALVAAACSGQTDKTFAVRLIDGANLSGTAPNNADGINRFIVADKLAMRYVGAPRKVEKTQRVFVLYNGSPVSGTAATLQEEIELLMCWWLKTQPLSASELGCLSAETIAGAECGYAFDDLSDGVFAGGMILTYLD